MSLKIGFTAQKENEQATAVMPAVGIQSAPRKSVVRVYFPERDMTCAYYNDAFDLHPGDTVYVEGKLEGLRGRVVEVSYSFKIKLTDYKRVISKADTEVHGEFFMGGSHFIAFDPFAIPFAKVRRTHTFPAPRTGPFPWTGWTLRSSPTLPSGARIITCKTEWPISASTATAAAPLWRAASPTRWNLLTGTARSAT